MNIRHKRRHNGRGFSLIEIMVAMAILGIAFTSLFAMQVRIMARQRKTTEQSERNAVLMAEIGRIESMRYTALDSFLVQDTLWMKDGVRRTAKDSTAYARKYTITANGASAPTCLASAPCKDIRIAIVPLSPIKALGVASSADSIWTTVRRSKVSTVNPLFTQ